MKGYPSEALKGTLEGERGRDLPFSSFFGVFFLSFFFEEFSWRVFFGRVFFWRVAFEVVFFEVFGWSFF